MPPLDQNQYVHAMAEDTATGKPMPKVSIAGADSSSGALGVDVKASQIIVPTDVQSRYAQTIQAHSGVMVSPSGAPSSAWIDTNGFSELSVTMSSDATHTSDLTLNWSNDGVNIHGWDSVISNASRQYGAGSVSTRARYVRLVIGNKDAAPHTMSAWAYLKA
jgi:hypothetical protein